MSQSQRPEMLKSGFGWVAPTNDVKWSECNGDGISVSCLIPMLHSLIVTSTSDFSTFATLAMQDKP